MTNSVMEIKRLGDVRFIASCGSQKIPEKIEKIRVHEKKIFAIIFHNFQQILFIFGKPTGDVCELIDTIDLGSPITDFAWSPLTHHSLLAVVTERGDALVYDFSSLTVSGATIQNIEFHRFVNPNFSQIEFSKDGSMIAIVSNTELIIVEKKNFVWKQTKPVLDFTTSSTDYISSIAIHPEKCAVAICSTAQKGVILVGIPGYKLDVQETLRKNEENDFHLNSNILNIIPLEPDRGVPIACVWSPYGEILAVATSDNLLSIWNVSDGSFDTFGLDENNIVIREIFFYSDSVLIVSTSDETKFFCVNVDDGVIFETEETRRRDGEDNRSRSGGFLSGQIMYKPRRNNLISRFQLKV